MRRFFETKTKLHFITARLVLLVLAAILVAPAASAQTTGSLQDQLKQKQEQLAKIQDQINSYQTRIGQTQKQGNTLKNQLSIFEDQISSLELQIQANNTRTDDVTVQIKEIEEQIARRRAEISDNQKILSQLIVQLNEMDSNSLLYMGLGNDSFSAFLDQVQYNESVQGKVFQIVQNIKAIEQQLEQQQADLQKQLEQLKQLHDQLDINQSSLTQQRQQKQGLLNQTKGLERNYQKLLSQSQGEEDKIQQEVNNLDNSIRAKLGNLPVPVVTGKFAWPMAGVLTQGYGNTGFTALGYSFHNGYDIAAPPGTPIYAVGDGVVVACDTGEAAYGNWCAIKHTLPTGRQLVSLYAHMRTFRLSGGQVVKQGDLVGYEGNTGNTTRLTLGENHGFHIHLSFFDAQGFGISPGAYTKTYGHYTVPYGYTYNPGTLLGPK
jgi:murein DD-endopeptidase MepM/ murein hydrolase activator NlpD